MIEVPGQSNYLGNKGSPQHGGMAASAAVQMPEEERERVKFIGQMFQKAAQYRAVWDKHWPRYWNLWEGNHYYAKTVHTLTRGIINQIYSQIETMVGHVADVLTPPNVFARGSEGRDKAELISKWLKTAWDTSNGDTEMQHVVRSASVCGVGWLEVPWDSTAANGRGDIALIPCDERFIFLSPHAKTLRDALYLIDARNVPREYVEKAWERGAEVPPGVWFPQVSNKRTYQGEGDGDSLTETLTTDGTQSGWSQLSSGAEGGGKDLVTLLKVWTRQQDSTMRLTVVANGVILQDGPSPYDDEDFPYVQVNLLPTLDTYCGRSLVQFVEGLQEVVDESLSYLLDVQRYAADPMLVVAVENLEEANVIENMPGAILPDRTQGNGYNWLNGPGFNQSWMTILDSIINSMDSVLGRVDVLKGEQPAGVNTLGGLEIIRDEANVRIRNLMRWVKAGVKRAYLLILARLRQFAIEEREMRVANKKGREEYIKVNPVKGHGLDGEPRQEKTIPENVEFEVDFGPEEPGGEQARREFVMGLLTTPAEDGLPMVTRRWALEQLDIQEKEELLQEFDEIHQMQAKAAQQEAGTKNGGGAPPEPGESDPMEVIKSVFG